MAWIDDEGVHVPMAVRENLALEIDGRQIWAFAPARDGRAVDDHRLVAWPETLVPFLNGRADVVLRVLDTGEALLDSSVSLGDGDGSIELVDRHGRPLSVSKSHKLTAAMFGDATDHERGLLVDAVAEALEFLSERGHTAFLAYGNLLGAVRNGKLIGHDNDADIAILAESSHPVDVILESMAVERAFVEAGWDTARVSGADFKLFATLPDGLQVGIDVFSAFYMDGLLHVMPCVAAPLPREALLPSTTVELEGRAVTAPADPEALLEATYGPGWRQPDPAFRYRNPRWLRRRVSGLFRGERRHLQHWDVFYRTKAARVPSSPSPFARWVAGASPRPTSMVDVGCGTGRDSLWLADQGIDVLGCDYSGVATSQATHRARELRSQASFHRLNLYDLRQSLTYAALLARERPTDAVYARFMVHALEAWGRRNLWRFSRSVLSGTRGRIYLEFRTEPTKHVFGEHFRQFVHPDVVCEELASYGFVVEHCETGHGLAPHEDEDPSICRIIAKMEDRSHDQASA